MDDSSYFRFDDDNKTKYIYIYTSSYHHQIFRSYCHWQKWCPCKRSRSEVKGGGYSGHTWLRHVIRQISRSYGTKKSPILIGRFWTVIPFRIHIRLWNDAQSFKWHRRGALLFFKVIRQDHMGQKIAALDPNWAFPDCYFSSNSQMATKWCPKLEIS